MCNLYMNHACCIENLYLVYRPPKMTGMLVYQYTQKDAHKISYAQRQEFEKILDQTYC